jgi:hypothetical protein
MYGRVFDGHHEGRIILEDLVARFYDRPSFVEGAVEGARKTDHNEGKRAVVGFILNRIGQITTGEDDES